MNIDKKSLEALMKLPDDKLIGMLRVISGMGGVPSVPASPETVAGLRNVMRQMTDADISRLTELIATYKQGKKG